MKLHHLNLTVTDVRAASAFLEKYFGMQSTGGNAGMGFVTDGEGFVLTLMKSSPAAVSYPPNFHIGFYAGNTAEVDAIHDRLQADGYKVTQPDHHHGYTFYVEAPGGFTVELGA